MSNSEYGQGPPPFHAISRLGSGRGDFIESQRPRPHHGGGSFGAGDQWAGSDRGRELGWNGDGGSDWNSREPQGMPPGNFLPRGRPPMFEGRDRGGFGGRGNPDFGFRGRGGPGRFGRGWGSDDMDARSPDGRPWSHEDAQAMGDRPGFGGRGGFRGRADFGRGRGGGGRFGGGRWAFEGRGRRDGWQEDGPHDPDIDPALLERRRASEAALIRRQASQLQVSRELLGDGEVAEEYSRVMELEAEAGPRADVRRLYTYPMFAAEGSSQGFAPQRSQEDQVAAFEHCLQLYQDAQDGQKLVQSDHGNFLMPAT